MPLSYPASAHKAELQQVVVGELGSMDADAGATAAFQGADAVFCCLGTTRAVGETHSWPKVPQQHTSNMSSQQPMCYGHPPGFRTAV